MIPFIYKEIPEHYLHPARKRGTVSRLAYPAEKHGSKYAYIYTPYGYDSRDRHTRYDILYLMHGAKSSVETFLWGDGENSHFKNILDHCIEKQELPPLIVVTPGLYPTGNIRSYNGQEVELSDTFTEELPQLMNSVESMYLTYADTIDSEGFRASRTHRAFGGFSLGAVVTWYVFDRFPEYFSTFLPICGDCWACGKFGGEHEPEQTAAWLADSVRRQHRSSNSFRIFTATGEQDMAYKGLTRQTSAMAQQRDVFSFLDSTDTGSVHGVNIKISEPPQPTDHRAASAVVNPEDANLLFFTIEKGEHNYFYAYEYICAAIRSWLSCIS